MKTAERMNDSGDTKIYDVKVVVRTVGKNGKPGRPRTVFHERAKPGRQFNITWERPLTPLYTDGQIAPFGYEGPEQKLTIVIRDPTRIL